jgi:hypothetical protein
VYAESRVIVSRLIRAFLQESQPKIIGSDMYLSGLRRLLIPMMNERSAFLVRSSASYTCSNLNNTQDNQDCTLDAIVDRNVRTNRYPYVRVNRYPWSSELRYPDAARFLHQTIRALVPDETTGTTPLQPWASWNNMVPMRISMGSITYEGPMYG